VYVRFIALIDLFLFGVESQKRKELKAMSDAFKKWIDCSPFVINTGNEEKVAKLAWEASRASTFAEVARLREAFEELLKSHGWFTAREYDRDTSYNSDSHGYKEEEFAMLTYRNIFGEEELGKLLESFASLAPAKTCRWTWEPGSGYYTCKGSVAAGVGIGMLKELGYLYCHSCGLPIEEVKEETT
jgi:hypothetical protein